MALGIKMIFELNTSLCLDWIYSISLDTKYMTAYNRHVWSATNNQTGDRNKRKRGNSVYVNDLHKRNNIKIYSYINQQDAQNSCD